MIVRVSIEDGPLGLWPEGPAIEGAGAVVEFVGVVRPEEHGRAITALDYEVYEPMAGREMLRLAQEIGRRRALLAILVRHSRGQTPVGAASLRVLVASRRRAEALAALAEFIDGLKSDVPIWKRPVYAPSLTS